MAALHIEVTGQGEPLVMLHGWGMHGGIWDDTAAQLAQDFEVHCVDLPGHGASTFPSPSGRGSKGEGGQLVLDEIVQQLSAQFSEPITLCGWSLGGIIAQHWAVREPDKVKRLVLVASTPSFAQRSDWDCGMPQDTLTQFATELENNYTATLRRFLALQVRGGDGARELLTALREKLFSRGEPHLSALRSGLSILRDVDLRSTLPKIKQPTLVIAGEHDRLTPIAAADYLAENLPNGRVVEIKGAAHAPFLSHQNKFIEHLKHFLHE